MFIANLLYEGDTNKRSKNSFNPELASVRVLTLQVNHDNSERKRFQTDWRAAVSSQDDNAWSALGALRRLRSKGWRISPVKAVRIEY
jgi:hypothetical protein